MWPIWCSKLEYSAHCFDPAFPRWRCSVMFGDESLMIVLAAAPGRTKDDLNCVSGFQIFQMSSQKKMEDWHNWWIFWKGKNNKSWHFCCTKHAQSMHFCHPDPQGPCDPRSEQTAPQETAAFRLTGGNSELQSSGSDLLGEASARSRHFPIADTITGWWLTYTPLKNI